MQFTVCFAVGLRECLIISVGIFFRQVTNDDIELVEVVTVEGFLSIAGDHSLTAKVAKHILEYGTQIIVVIDDENPTFLHPTPICQQYVKGESEALTKWPSACFQSTLRHFWLLRSKIYHGRRRATEDGRPTKSTDDRRRTTDLD